MTRNVTLDLPEEMVVAMNEVMREDGIAADLLVTAALKDYITIRKYHRLREAMMGQAPRAYTDDEIFESVS